MENGSGYLVSVSEKEWENGIELLKMRRKGAEDDVVGCLCDRIFLDRLFGDPVWLYHPVRMIGNMISFLEKRLRKENDKKI